MKLVIPQSAGFSFRTQGDRILIETNLPKEDRELDRAEVARRLKKSVRMIDMYRRLTGEARLQSYSVPGKSVVIKESELNRWIKFLKANEHLVISENLDGSSRSFRPRARRRSSMARRHGVVSGITTT
jgi:hypothetical protein